MLEHVGLDPFGPPDDSSLQNSPVDHLMTVSISNLPTRAWIVLRRDGPGALVSKAVARLRKAILSHKTVSIISIDLADFSPHYLKRRKFCDVVPVSREDLERVRSPYFEDYRQMAYGWLDRGDRCFMAVKDGEPVGLIDVMFVSFADKEGLRVEVGEGECKIADVVVFPPYRQTSAVAVLNETALVYAQQIGMRRVLGAISFWDDRDLGGRPALRAALHLGYREIRRVKCVRFLSRFAWARDVDLNSPHVERQTPKM